MRALDEVVTLVFEISDDTVKDTIEELANVPEDGGDGLRASEVAIKADREEEEEKGCNVS